MMKRASILCLLLLAPWMGSCQPQPAQPPQPVASEIEVSAAALKEQAQELQNQISRLKAENGMLQSQIEELRRRDTKLSEQIRLLQFIGEEQKKQIETLAQAPIERDRYRARLESLKEEIAYLSEQSEVMKKTLHPMVAAIEKTVTDSAPTTLPAITPLLPATAPGSYPSTK